MNTKTRIIISILTILVLTGVAAGGYYLQQKNKLATPDLQINPPALEIEKIPKEVKIPEPERSDFGTNIPSEFPSDILIEKDAVVQQSYSLTYEGQKQLSIVFVSQKTVKENFNLYRDFLEKQAWRVVNEYESETLSSLYGNREKNDINVTISGNSPTESQISISILKK